MPGDNAPPVVVPLTVTSRELSAIGVGTAHVPVEPVTHEPPEHVWPAAHARPHEPQFAESLLVFTQAAPQIVRIAEQVQTPPEQLSPVRHACPQEPQFAAFDEVSTHVVPHDTCGGVHTHAPSAQMPGQRLLHAPQFCESVDVSTQRPEQLLSVPGHTHTPPTHDVGPEQWLPHAPQLLMSVFKSTHVPRHSIEQVHAPATHTGVVPLQ